MMTKHYQVAGHTFAVSGQVGLFALMENYEPFECADAEPLFSLTEDNGLVPEYTEDFRQEEEGSHIICGHTASGNDVYEFLEGRHTAGWLVCSKNYGEGRLIMPKGHSKLAIDNALMIMFALATAEKDTLLFHAAMVSCEGKGYLFLGPSGTGKSTHAQLWLKHFEGTELVNDDNPVVRDGVVYGSPWSGKTPCYRNVNVPIGGIVSLSQAPYNEIHRLKGIQAYVAVVESVGGKLWDSRIASNLHQTENRVVSTIPIWHLDCLPDQEAARLCHDTITR